MWTYTDDLTILTNLTVRSKFKDGVLKYFQIYPCEGYVLRVPILDEYLIKENGEYILDEKGNPILVKPYRTYGGATAVPDYDWSVNPSGFYAEVYEKYMDVR